MSRFRRYYSLLKFFVRQLSGFHIAEEPGLDSETLKEFKKRVLKSSLYVEFGTGGSTVFADRHGIRAIGVESDPFYARSVRRKLSSQSRVSVIVRSIGINGPWGHPVFCRNTASQIRRNRAYVQAPFEQSPALVPDFILIDGRLRRACALVSARHSVERGASTVILFDDYYKQGREGYSDVERFLGQPRRLGRSALFDVGPDSLAMAPDEADIDEALADFS